MKLYGAARNHDPGCAAARVAPGDPRDRQITEHLIQRPGGLRLYGLAQPGLIFGDRQISLGERLTEAGDDLLPFTVADPDLGIAVGRVMRSSRW